MFSLLDIINNNNKLDLRKFIDLLMGVDVIRNMKVRLKIFLVF